LAHDHAQGTASFAEACAKIPLPASPDRLDPSRAAHLVGTLTASAANDDTANQGAFGMAYPGQGGAYGAPGQGGGPGRHGGPRGDADESKSQRPDEELLTGDTAAKVREAALARYPGATILRVETDADGVYEAHLTTSDGRRVTVEVDRSFEVTGEESGPGRP
jgi:hypothetical protein